MNENIIKNSANQKTGFQEIIFLLLSFSLTLPRVILSFIIGILVIEWLFSGNWKSKASNIKSNYISLLPSLLFILYSIGLIYTESWQSGISDIETKMGLLFLPVIMASLPKIDEMKFRKIMWLFVAGCIVSIVICISYSLYNYYTEKQFVLYAYISTDFFFSSRLSVFMHPSYFAIYLNLAMIWIFYGSAWSKINPFNVTMLLVLNIAITIFIFFLTSKIGILLALVIWAVFIMYVILKRKWYTYGVVFSILLISIVILLLNKSKIIASRFEYSLKALSTPPDITSTESSSVRLLVWKVSRELISEKPIMGYGTGDVHSALDTKYKSYGMSGALEHHLNAHNQFFQTAIAIGLPGLLVLCLALFVPLGNSIKKKDLLYICFFIIFFLNIVVEAMLQTQAGVIYYSFFSSLLFLRSVS